MGQKALIGTMLCGLGATLVLPGVASAQQDRVSGTEKGSLCIFSKVEIKWESTDLALEPTLVQDTFISFTNDYPEDVLVQMYFINGDPPLDEELDDNGNLIERSHKGWNFVDVGITLTMNEPTYWSSLTGQPKGVSPFTILDPRTTLGSPGRPCPECGDDIRCLRGYIVAWAVNSENEQIRWNHLKGEGTLVNYANGYAWEYNSYNHQVLDPVAHNATVGTPGTLNLDGTDYSLSFEELLLNFQASGSTAWKGDGAAQAVMSDTDLTLFPVGADLNHANNTGPKTTQASVLVWNENETKFSGTRRCITCWDQTLISNYDPPNNFSGTFLQTDHGKARIKGIADSECDVLDDPNTPEDESVTSVASPLLGVYARLLTIGAATVPGAAAGSNLIGLGTDDTAVITYSPSGSPPGAADPDSPKEILDWLEKEAGIERPSRPSTGR